MDGNSVIDGDVGCNSNDDDDSTSNHETSLSYFDEKIQNVLGHFQKDFEGGVFADNLGAKYGGYGSFLLSREGSPCRESNEKNGIQISHSICPTKEVKRHSSIPGTIPKLAADLFSSVKHPYVNPNAQLSSRSAELKSDFNGSILPKANSEQRPLKLRIKVGSSGNLKTPTINLGVDPNKSSFPSNGHSLGGRERTFQASNKPINESPATILQVMASFPVKDAPLSPLPESMLCFIGKESCNDDSKENNSKKKISLNKDSSTLTKRKHVLMEDPNLRERSLVDDSTETADVIGQQLSLGKDSRRRFSQNIKHLSRKAENKNLLEERRSDLAHRSIKRADVFQGISEDGNGDRAVSSRKEERESSILNSSVSDKNLSTGGALMSKKNLLAESADAKAKKMKFESLSNGNFTAFSPQKDAKGNHNRISSFSVDDVTNKAKMMKRKYSPVSSSEINKHELFMTTAKKQAMNNEKMKNTYKSLTEISRISKSSEHSDISEMDLKSSAFSSQKSKMKYDDHKGTTDLYRQNIHDSNRPLVEDKWVMCDSCEKWRLLPYASNPEKLPEKWLCSMLDWLPGMNRCDVSEEETTKALCAQYQISPDVVLTYHQNYKDSARGYASAIKENKRTYHEKSQLSAKTLTRDCLKTNNFGGITQSSKSAVNNAEFEMRAENHIADDSSDELRVRKKTKKTVLHGVSDVSRGARANLSSHVGKKETSYVKTKGVDRQSEADFCSQQKSKTLPDCPKNEPIDMRQRILVSLKVRETKASDAKSTDLRCKDPEIRSNGCLEKRNIRKTHALCENAPRKAKCAENLKDTEKKKKSFIACSSASKVYECQDNDLSDAINPGIISKSSTEEKLNCPCNSNKDAIKCSSIIAGDDSETIKETSKGKTTDRRIQTARSSPIQSDKNKLKRLQVRGNEKALKKNDQHLDSNTETRVQAEEPSDLSATSPLRVTSPTQAASDILKEAQILKDRADSFRGNETYFEAALKFLHGAYLLDSSVTEVHNNGDMTQYQAYSTAAHLCGCCSKEYERLNDMATSALAYKCKEVAYWNMVYCRNSISGRDRTELQASLQLLPPGDSPSSSASDVDNLNNPNTDEKVVACKESSNRANHLIPAKSNPHLLRLLDYTRDVHAAVECSKKAQAAFIAAEGAAEKAKKKECLSSVKTVLNYSFQGVDRFVQLLRIAMKDVNRSGLSVAEG